MVAMGFRAHLLHIKTRPTIVNANVKSSGVGKPLRVRARLLLLSILFQVYKLHVWLMGVLPEAGARRVARVISPLFVIPRRTHCRENLRRFFDPLGWTHVDRSRLQMANTDYLARLRVDISRGFVMSPEELRERVSLEGEHHLVNALNRGRGVMLVGSHMGTWWHAPGILAIHDHPITAVFNSIPLRGVEDYMRRFAARFNVSLTFVGQGAQAEAREIFRHNQVLYLSFDVTVRPSRSRWMAVGPAEIQIDPGPAIMAMRYRVPVLQITTTHVNPNRSIVKIHPETIIPKGKIDRADAICRGWLETLTTDILAHPEQWWAWNYSTLRPAVTPSVKTAPRGNRHA